MYSVVPVSVRDFKENVSHLLEENHKSVTESAYPLEVNWEGYEGLEKLGMLLALCLFKDEKLIGYCVVLQMTNLHSSQYVSAIIDTIYIVPEERGYRPFKVLLKSVEDKVGNSDAASLLFHSHVNNPIDKLLEKNGYTRTEVVYKKGMESNG